MEPRKEASTIRAPEVNKRTNLRQLPSFLLFLSAIILLNLCPFQTELNPVHETNEDSQTLMSQHVKSTGFSAQLYNLEACANFVKLMFTNPLRLDRKATSFFVADAKVIGKMVKVLYIKKKIKKLGKKLKKHTIAVPVFTAIPIYEQSYL